MVGFWTRNGPMMAIRMRTTMTMPPAMATLSRRSRIQAIWPSDRPSIALAPAPSSTDSGAAASVDTSSGAVIGSHSPDTRHGGGPPPGLPVGPPVLYRRISPAHLYALDLG